MLQEMQSEPTEQQRKQKEMKEKLNQREQNWLAAAICTFYR